MAWREAEWIGKDGSESGMIEDNILPIRLRDDVTVRIAGIPHDLTADEATKIARVIRSFAEPSRDTSAQSAGGHARAGALTAEQRSSIAKTAADARWRKT